MQPNRRRSSTASCRSLTDVRAGEGVSALMLAANIFTLLAFYSVLKAIRDALILTRAAPR